MRTVLYKNRLFFTKREAFKGKTLSLHFEVEGEVLLENAKGRARFPTKEGEARIPLSAFAPGENRLSLHYEKQMLPCEGLWREEDRLSPMGFAAEGVLADLIQEEKALRQKLLAAESRLARLEEKIDGFRLF